MNMRALKHSPLILLALCAALDANAQWDLFFDGAVPVTRAGQSLDLAWSGGANFIQVSDIDLNGDGLKDLFIFDRSGNTVTTLLNNGQPGTMAYSLTRAYQNVHPLPELHDWVLLRDFNCDGKEDIYTYSQAGFSVYKNTSIGEDLSFELVTFRVNSNYISPSGAGTMANLFISQVDLPAIDDVDGDGDLDVLTFSLLGSYLEYHKNLSVETYGTCDSLKFELRNKCWGFFAENFNTNSVTLNVPCNFNVPDPEIGGNGLNGERPTDPSEDDRAHAGSTVLALDLNGDGVKEVLLGDISYNNLVGLYNGGSVEEALMTVEDTLFPSYDTSVALPLFPGGYFEDVDNDGKRDLLVSGNATSLSENAKSVWYYHNAGTDAAPIFERVQEDVFQDRMIDHGEGAFPIAFDHDGDGLMDLVVANHGYFASAGAYIGKLALYRNTGTALAPAFTLVTDDYAGLSTSGIGLSMYPAFGDVDGDGDQDMYIGDLQGRLHAYQNTPVGGVAQFTLLQANVLEASGAAIDVGQFATPQFTDLDQDGRLDLLIGERNGNLNYYRNTGTATSPAWTLTNENIGGVSTVEWWNVTGYSVPNLFVAPTGGRQLLLGSESGWLYHYGDIDGNLEGTWTLLDSTFMDLRDGIRSGLCLHDYTGDGVLDMVVGNYRGGLSFWRSDLGSAVNAPNASSVFSLYPNPATDGVELILRQMLAGPTTVTLLNTQGQVIHQQAITSERITLDISGLNTGVYVVRLMGPTGSFTQRLIVTGRP